MFYFTYCATAEITRFRRLETGIRVNVWFQFYFNCAGGCDLADWQKTTGRRETSFGGRKAERKTQGTGRKSRTFDRRPQYNEHDSAVRYSVVVLQSSYLLLVGVALNQLRTGNEVAACIDFYHSCIWQARTHRGRRWRSYERVNIAHITSTYGAPSFVVSGPVSR